MFGRLILYSQQINTLYIRFRKTGYVPTLSEHTHKHLLSKHRNTLLHFIYCHNYFRWYFFQISIPFARLCTLIFLNRCLQKILTEL